MLRVWIEFAVTTVVILWAGVRVSRYGDVIAERTGLGRGWIGLVLVASVTSLPELVTGLSAVTAAGAPDIAAGDALGSCVFNLLLLVLVDFLSRKEPLYARAASGHVLAAGFGVILIGFVGYNVMLAGRGLAPAIGHVGLATPILLVLYAIAMRAVYRYARDHRAEYVEQSAAAAPDVTLREAVAQYALGALVVLGAGVGLPFIAERMAHAMGWELTFVGSLLVALATSLPELAVTVAAVRMGALDLAVGNLLGSNLFNMAIVALDDLAYLEGPIYARVSPLHAVSASSAVIMTGVTIVGLFYRPRHRVLRAVGWASLLLFSLYILDAYALYVSGAAGLD